jgi:hypothetical protein
MDYQLQELKQILRDRNDITTAALNCATLVLTQARELGPEKGRPMLVLLKKLISIDTDEKDFTA